MSREEIHGGEDAEPPHFGYYYQLLDADLFDSFRVLNCIHALAGVIGKSVTGLDHGFAAAEDLVKFFSGSILDYPHTASPDILSMIDLTRRLEK
jgi:hypothetical protein